MPSKLEEEIEAAGSDEEGVVEEIVEEMVDGDHDLFVLPEDAGIYQPTEEFEDAG